MPEPIIGVDALIKAQLSQNLTQLETKLRMDVMSFVGPVVFGVDELVRDALESIDHRRSGLAVILDTLGGVVEVVERLVDTIRHHYADVSFIIPDRAMSAGTVFALSGDAIYMDYFSVLGPIDPQIQKDKKLVPALAYLVQYERMIQRSVSGELTTAELALLQKLDLGELQLFEEARELSVELLKKWLVKYKFKDWHTTDTTKQTVSQEYKQTRAADIARALSNSQRWHSHSRGISMDQLRGEELKLKIDDFGADPELSKLIRSYFNVIRESMLKDSITHFIHTSSSYLAE